MHASQALNKNSSFFNKPGRAPSSLKELIKHGGLNVEEDIMLLASSPIIIAASSIDGPGA